MLFINRGRPRKGKEVVIETVIEHQLDATLIGVVCVGGGGCSFGGFRALCRARDNIRCACVTWLYKKTRSKGW